MPLSWIVTTWSPSVREDLHPVVAYPVRRRCRSTGPSRSGRPVAPKRQQVAPLARRARRTSAPRRSPGRARAPCPAAPLVESVHTIDGVGEGDVADAQPLVADVGRVGQRHRPQVGRCRPRRRRPPPRRPDPSASRPRRTWPCGRRDGDVEAAVRADRRAEREVDRGQVRPRAGVRHCPGARGRRRDAVARVARRRRPHGRRAAPARSALRLDRPGLGLPDAGEVGQPVLVPGRRVHQREPRPALVHAAARRGRGSARRR